MKSVVATANGDSATATQTVVSEAREKLGSDERIIAAMAFIGADHDASVIAPMLREMLGEVPIVGCTTDGEIANGLAVDSVSLMVIASNDVRAKSVVIEDLRSGSFEAAQQAAKALAAADARALVLLPDGLAGNGTAIIRGAQSVLGPDFVIGGGTAGDRGRFVKTYQLHGGRVYSGSLVALMFYGPASLEVGYGVQSGWQPIGVAKVVTRAVGNVVYEIDGKSALDFYKTFLGDRASQLPAIGVEYPFALVDESGRVGQSSTAGGEEYLLLRAPMNVNHADGSITFAGEIPQGAKVKMTRAKSDAVIDASRDAAQRASKSLSGPADAVMFFSCMARRLVLGRRTSREIEVAREIFGADVPMIGFYTYGEIGNCGDVAPTCRFHNETATFLAMRER
jgi:hypothetical protein